MFYLANILFSFGLFVLTTSTTLLLFRSVDYINKYLENKFSKLMHKPIFPLYISMYPSFVSLNH